MFIRKNLSTNLLTRFKNWILLQPSQITIQDTEPKDDKVYYNVYQFDAKTNQLMIVYMRLDRELGFTLQIRSVINYVAMQLCQAMDGVIYIETSDGVTLWSNPYRHVRVADAMQMQSHKPFSNENNHETAPQ